jgi:hypothetical protein
MVEDSVRLNCRRQFIEVDKKPFYDATKPVREKYRREACRDDQAHGGDPELLPRPGPEGQAGHLNRQENA